MSCMWVSEGSWKFWNLRRKVLCMDQRWGKLDFLRLGWFSTICNLPRNADIPEWETSNWGMTAFLLNLHPVVPCLYTDNEAFRGTFRKKPRIQKCLLWPSSFLPEVTVRSIPEDWQPQGNTIERTIFAKLHVPFRSLIQCQLRCLENQLRYPSRLHRNASYINIWLDSSVNATGV